MQIIHKLYAYLNCKSPVTLLGCLPHTWDEAPGVCLVGLSINKYLFNKLLQGFSARCSASKTWSLPWRSWQAS